MELIDFLTKLGFVIEILYHEELSTMYFGRVRSTLKFTRVLKLPGFQCKILVNGYTGNRRHFSTQISAIGEKVVDPKRPVIKKVYDPATGRKEDKLVGWSQTWKYLGHQFAAEDFVIISQVDMLPVKNLLKELASLVQREALLETSEGWQWRAGLVRPSGEDRWMPLEEVEKVALKIKDIVLGLGKSLSEG